MLTVAYDPQEAEINNLIELAISEKEAKKERAQLEMREIERLAAEKIHRITAILETGSRKLTYLARRSDKLRRIIASIPRKPTELGMGAVLFELGTSEPYTGYFCVIYRESQDFFTIELFEQSFSALPVVSEVMPRDRYRLLNDSWMAVFQKLTGDASIIQLIVERSCYE